MRLRVRSSPFCDGGAGFREGSCAPKVPGCVSRLGLTPKSAGLHTPALVSRWPCAQPARCSHPGGSRWLPVTPVFFSGTQGALTLGLNVLGMQSHWGSLGELGARTTTVWDPEPDWPGPGGGLQKRARTHLTSGTQGSRSGRWAPDCPGSRGTRLGQGVLAAWDLGFRRERRLERRQRGRLSPAQAQLAAASAQGGGIGKRDVFK